MQFSKSSLRSGRASTAPNSNTRSTRRIRVAIVSAAALVGALVPLIATANLSGSTFESTDGDLIVTNAGNLDWVNAPNRVAGVDAASGSGDNSFGQGTKEDDVTPSVVTGSIPPNKSDLTRFYVANDKGSNDHQFLYLAWERTNTLGSANMDFEINKLAQPDLTTTGQKNVSATRSEGDLLVRYDFSNGGTVPTLSLVKWMKAGGGGTAADCAANNALPCWGAKPADDALDGTNDNQIDLSDAGFADGSINIATVTDTIANPDVDLPEATFGEAAIDLTASGVFAPGVCTNFGSAYLKSRSAASFTAETKDFIAPQTISINNCGNLTIEKVTVGGTGTFGFNSSTLADQTAGDATTKFNLTTATAGTAVSTGTTYRGILAGTYDVAENAKTGWTLTAIACRNADNSVHAATIDVAARTLSVAIAVDDDVTCRFTNTAKATLRVDKVTSPSGDSKLFTFEPGAGLSGGNFQLADATTPKAYVDILPGSYSVTEQDPGSDWKLTALACKNTGDSSSHSATTSLVTRDFTVTLAAGEDVTCTFTNTKNAKVTINKSDDDNPTNAVDGAVFKVYEDLAPASTSAPGAEDLAGTPVFICTISSGTCSSGFVLTPGTFYWVVEDSAPTGYTKAAPQRISGTAGATVTVSFVDKREFKVITLVCQNSDNSLYPSSVTLNKEGSGSDNATSISAAQLAAFNTAHGTNITAAQLCDLTGAVFSPRHHGSYDGNVNIPQ